MPQQFPAVPSLPKSPRRLCRALLLSAAGLAVSTTPALAATGGAEAGDPAAQSRSATPVAATAAPSRTAIRAVQRKLRLQADGVYGPRSRAAVRRFQRRHGLRPSGRLTARTLEALGVVGRAARAPAGPAPSGEAARLLAAIAQCESGGDPTAVSSNGLYRGKYQFHTATWKSMGGTGNPAAAPEAEQDQRAAALLAAQGTTPWPVCGREASG